MIPASFDYQDPTDTERGRDDETTSVDECVHGEHPIECSLCTSAGFIAAVSGEEETVEPPVFDGSNPVFNVDAWVNTTEDIAELKRIYYAIERRRDQLQAKHDAQGKALASFSKPPRATRKDAGMKREEYKATKGAA